MSNVANKSPQPMAIPSPRWHIEHKLNIIYIQIKDKRKECKICISICVQD